MTNRYETNKVTDREIEIYSDVFLEEIKESLDILLEVIKGGIKNFLYDQILYPIYCIKNKIYYGSWDFFSFVGIETTTYCNLKCRFCPNSIYERGELKNKKMLSEKLFKKIIDELSEINYRGTVSPHFFGEPLSDSRIPELMKYTRKKLPKAKIIIASNGLLLTINLYNELVKIVDEIRITQYGTMELKNIKEIINYCKTTNKRNIIFYRKFTEKMAVNNRGGEIESEYASRKPICTYPFNEININYNGEILSCCNDYHGNIVLGDVKKDNLLNIWNSKKYKNFRKDLRNYKFEHSICKNCVGEGIGYP